MRYHLKYGRAQTFFLSCNQSVKIGAIWQRNIIVRTPVSFTSSHETAKRGQQRPSQDPKSGFQTSEIARIVVNQNLFRAVKQLTVIRAGQKRAQCCLYTARINVRIYSKQMTQHNKVYAILMYASALPKMYACLTHQQFRHSARSIYLPLAVTPHCFFPSLAVHKRPWMH